MMLYLSMSRFVPEPFTGHGWSGPELRLAARDVVDRLLDERRLGFPG
jgi:hypothetical protein